jgi:hypothetical protein
VLKKHRSVAAGSNFRLPQPLNGRVLRVWRDGDDKKPTGYLPEDAASAASAGDGGNLVTADAGCLGHLQFSRRHVCYMHSVSNSRS